MGPDVNRFIVNDVLPAIPHKEEKPPLEWNVGRFPRVGEGVRIDAREGVFVVLCTDLDRGTADVLPTSGIRRIEGGIPLHAMRMLRGKIAPVERIED